jgi:hypothetical protein
MGSWDSSPNSNVKIVHRYTLGDTKQACFQVRYDYNDKYIAAAMADGSIKIFNVLTTKPSYILNEDLEEKMPTLAIRYVLLIILPTLLDGVHSVLQV